MPAISKGERLLNLLAFLLKSRRPVSLAQIRQSVVGYGDGGASGKGGKTARAGSMERRFERDKGALRELGVPLKFVGADEPGGPGYLVPREAYFLPRLQLTPEETTLLALAGRFLMAGAAGPVSEALRSALRKLQFDSPFPVESRETAEEHFLFDPCSGGERRAKTGAATPGEQENLRQLTGAVLHRRAVKFSYYAIGSDRLERRTAAPYGIGFSAGHWYLVAYDRVREDIRVFRTDRIRGRIERLHAESFQPEYELPAGFRVQDYVGVPPWLFGKDASAPVKIRFDAEVAFMVRLRPAPGDRWEEQPDGAAILTRQATHPDSLLPWTLGFGRHAEALEPAEFRRRVAAALEAVAAAHERRP